MRGKKAVQVVDAPRKTLAYCRVSTEEQARAGVSIEAQQDRLRAYGSAIGREIDEFVIDAGYSAKNLKRPGMEKILEQVRAGTVAAVVVLKLDRLSRSVRDLADLTQLFAKHDVALLSVSETLDTSSAAGRVVLNLLAALSQFEREQVSERTQWALEFKRKSHRVYGRIPFGWLCEGDKLVPNAKQQAALKTALEMHRSGSTLRQIAAMFERQGVGPQRGGKKGWHAASVRSVLRSRATAELSAAI